MIVLRHDLPASNAVLRQALYDGDVFLLPPTPASRALVADAVALIEEELGRDGPTREAQFRLGDGEFFERVGRLRKKLYTEAPYHSAVRSLVAELGFDPARLAFDPIRLRVVAHRGHENPRAAPIYYAHRDTWYAHSQAEITWWVPLHDVTEEETFVFYPDYFRSPVSNNSECFDYDQWTRHGASLRIGWQSPDHGVKHLYPGHTGTLEPGRMLGFAARAGDIVLFAGAHFHQTRGNTTGRTRFSLDFRTVDLDDHEKGHGAPNTDNRSTGSALRDYVKP
jgi:hypothetical protein